MTNRIIKCFVLLLLTTGLRAQSQPEPVYHLMTYPGPGGVHVQVMSADTNDLYAQANAFQIRRTEKGADNDKGRLIGTLRPVRSAVQFEAALGPDKYRQFLRTFGFVARAQVDTFLIDRARASVRQLLSATDIDFSRALGETLLDVDVKPGGFYGYQVIRVDKVGAESEVDRRGVLYRPNPEIGKVKPVLTRISATDSAVRFTWNVTFPPQFIPVDQSLINVNSFAEARAVAPQRPDVFTAFSAGALNTRFAVYYRLNDDARWRFLERYTASADSSGQFYSTARVACRPEDVVETRLIAEDYAGNLGDTIMARGVAVTNSQVEYIYGLNSRDTTNAIYLWWKKLARKPYYSGIELSRTSANTAPKVLGILPVDATDFTDPDVYPAGEIFTYAIRPLFVPFQDLRQEMPATTAQSCTQFRRPTPPFNLRVDTTGRLPVLSWDAADDKSRFAFIVYRGQSPSDMNPIGLPVKSNQYIDSANYLSPRVMYSYAVQSINLKQDTSVLSEYVNYRPTARYAKVDFSSPQLISSEIINSDAFLSWTDLRLNDDYIRGYELQRKRENDPDTNFKSLHAGMLEQPIFTDTTFSLGVTYVYRVTSVGLSGERGTFSMPVSVYGRPVSGALASINELTVKNMSSSVRVSWPAVEPTGIASYRIMRREPTMTAFTAVGTVSNGTFEFDDRSAKPGKTYVYAVQALSTNRQESAIRTTRSIYREVVR
ncbi:fibronectin type III domain-containing protein [Fibrella aquatica]|uniref:fibronectin type III domain-containing protein n=1 Tax=Fibrella aquatica TaxID=3242487 RepID=UPI003521A041